MKNSQTFLSMYLSHISSSSFLRALLYLADSASTGPRIKQIFLIFSLKGLRCFSTAGSCKDLITRIRISFFKGFFDYRPDRGFWQGALKVSLPQKPLWKSLMRFSFSGRLAFACAMHSRAIKSVSQRALHTLKILEPFSLFFVCLIFAPSLNHRGNIWDCFSSLNPTKELFSCRF